MSNINKLNKIVAISGKPGLYELVHESKKNFILKQIYDDKKFSLPMSKNIIHLNTQTIYKKDGNITLSEVFKAIYEKENKQKCQLPKSNEEIKNYFLSIIKDYDDTRVYPSVIKKIIKWYNILQDNNILNFEEEEKDIQEKDNKPNEDTATKDKKTTTTEKKEVKNEDENIKKTSKQKINASNPTKANKEEKKSKK